MGYEVVEKCEFLKEKNFSKDEMKMKRKLYTFTPLEPRDALGGRTSPACLFKEVKENEKIFMLILLHYTCLFKKLKNFLQVTRKFILKTNVNNLI